MQLSFSPIPRIWIVKTSASFGCKFIKELRKAFKTVSIVLVTYLFFSWSTRRAKAHCIIPIFMGPHNNIYFSLPDETEWQQEITLYLVIGAAAISKMSSRAKLVTQRHFLFPQYLFPFAESCIFLKKLQKIKLRCLWKVNEYFWKRFTYWSSWGKVQ